MAARLGDLGTFLLERGPSIRRVVLTGGIVGVPIVFTRFNTDPFNVPKLTLLLIVTAVAAAIKAAELLQGSRSPALRRMTVPALALVIPFALSWLLSPYKGFSLFGNYGRLQGLLPYVVVALFGMLVADAFAGRLRDLAWALLWAGGLVGAYAVVQTIGVDPFEWGLFGAPTEAISTTGNPNFTGGFLAIVLPVGAAVALTEKDHRGRARNLLLLTVAGWAVARSQGGYAAGVAALAVLGGVFMARRWRLARIAGIAVAALIAIGMLGAVVFTVVSDRGPAPSSFVLRGRWWQAAGGMALDNPIAGRGPDSFALEGVAYRTTEDALEQTFDFPDDPHSVPFSVAASTGFVGLAGWLIVIGWGIRRGLSLDANDIVANAFLGALVAYAIQSLVSIDAPPLRVALWVSVAGLAVADLDTKPSVTTKAGGKKKGRPPRQPLRRAPLVGAAAVAAVGIVVWSIAYLFVDAKALDALSLFAARDVDAAEEKFEEVLAFRHDPYYAGLRALELKDLAVEGEDPGAFETADEAFSYTDATPFVFGLMERGRLRVAWGRQLREPGATERAVAPMERALAIDDRNPLIRVELAEVLVDLERYDDAVAVLAPARDYVPTTSLPRFWGALALAAAHVGDLDTASSALETALALDPNDPLALEVQKILERADG